MNNEVLYLKLKQSVQTKEKKVYLRDLGEIYCSVKEIENKVRTLHFPTEPVKESGHYVFSVIDVMRVIRKEYPSMTIDNIGESDFILTFEEKEAEAEWFLWCKTVFVCLLAFFGAAFSIMAFNNDIGITGLFKQLYHILTGKISDGFTVLEVSYSVGVGVGILIFFHHFAHKKGKSDPTPLEIEMRTYEKNVNSTTIESKGRLDSER